MPSSGEGALPARTDNRVQIFQVDAFTSERFRGNPAGVCIPEVRLPESLCQAIAAEMNLSETAFLHPVGRKKDDIPRFGLRWFTPIKEVELCGHATLATARVLFSETGIDAETVAFDTKSGALFAHRDSGKVRIDLPSSPPLLAEIPDGLFEALGISSLVNVARSQGGLTFILIEVEEEDEIMSLRPDFRALKAIEGKEPLDGVIVTSCGVNSRTDGPSPDFVSRVFCPWDGVDEDPVTGAAHTLLGPYWSPRLGGKKEMRAEQVSGRGGEMTVRVDGTDRKSVV